MVVVMAKILSVSAVHKPKILTGLAVSAVTILRVRAIPAVNTEAQTVSAVQHPGILLAFEGIKFCEYSQFENYRQRKYCQYWPYL